MFSIRKDNSCNISPPTDWRRKLLHIYRMSALFYQSAAPRWAGAVKKPSDVWGQRCVRPCCGSGTWFTQVLHLFVPVEEQRLSWLTSWAPNKEGQAGRGSVLRKYPAGLRKEQGRKREADGLQPYMEKELLFPGFVTGTPGMVPDAAPAAPWCHQEVQLLKRSLDVLHFLQLAS